MDRTTNPSLRRIRARVLMMDLRLGHACAGLALEAKNEAIRLRNLLIAREAYELVKNDAELAPDQREAEEIRTGLEQLKADLKLLGEPNLE